MRTQGQLIPLFLRFAKVCLDETASDEKQVSDLYVSTLCLRSYVNTLVFTTGFQFGVGYSIRLVGVEGDTFLLAVGFVVKENAASGDAVVGPVVNGAFVVGSGTDNVGAVGVVIEGVGGDPGEMSESVPLSAALRI